VEESLEDGKRRLKRGHGGYFRIAQGTRKEGKEEEGFKRPPGSRWTNPSSRARENGLAY
jgi:hypothetical protein